MTAREGGGGSRAREGAPERLAGSLVKWTSKIPLAKGKGVEVSRIVCLRPKGRGRTGGNDDDGSVVPL